MAETENIGKFVLAIVVISVALIIGIYIMSTLQTTFRVDASGTKVNSTISGINNLTYVPLLTIIPADCVFTVTKVHNGTSSTVIPASNYTVSGCSIKENANSVEFGTVWNVSGTYTYSDETVTSNASGDLVDSLSDGTPWITILIVVGFAVVVLGFLTSGFRSKAVGENQPSPVY